MTAPIWSFRPEALAAYHEGTAPQNAAVPLRPARWPAVVLLGLLLLGVAFAAYARVPRAVDGVVTGTSGPYLTALFPGRLDPLPVAGAPVRATQPAGGPPLHVVRAEVVGDGASARRWAVPDTVPRPATIVLLAGRTGPAPERISLRIAAPTLLELVPDPADVLR